MFEGFDPFLNLSCTLVWLDFRTLGLLGHWPRDTRCGFQLELQLGSSLNLESQVGVFFFFFVFNPNLEELGFLFHLGPSCSPSGGHLIR